MERIGLVAGGGNFPVLFSREAKKMGAQVVTFAIQGITEPVIEQSSDRTHWIDVDKFSIPKFLFLLVAERIKKIVLVGKIDKAQVFQRMKTNKDLNEVLSSTKDNRDYSILDEVTKRFKAIGIDVIDGLAYLKDLMPQKGVLTKRLPSERESQDIIFGLPIAQELARLDIGQTITVKGKAVITVEAIEGTDQTIRRAREFVKDEFVVIKVARPRQDMRWDVPLVGLDTIKAIIEAHGSVLAIESGKMFFAERDKAVREADLHNLTIVVV
ncbi:MAG: UDP-2,3-diacylglucosamine diphosphatase LpxI [Candidatus Omnitrophica bacterium]|nr:UDP-2,3-diacylglucosamine diphosphatase LpxI [Candidatus Omnitrophota bacterium]